MCRSPAGRVGRLARSSTVPGSSCTPCQRSSPCPQDADRDDECREATQRRDVLERGVHRVALGVVQRQPRRPQRVGLARLLHWRFGLTGDEPAGGADACTSGPDAGVRPGTDRHRPRWELTLLRSRGARKPSQRRSAQQIPHHCADGSCRSRHLTPRNTCIYNGLAAFFGASLPLWLPRRDSA